MLLCSTDVVVIFINATIKLNKTQLHKEKQQM